MKTRHLHLRQLNSLTHFLRVHPKQMTPILRLHPMSCWSSWQWGWQGLLTDNLGQFYSHIGGQHNWLHKIFRGRRNSKCGTLQTFGWDTEELESNSHHLSAAWFWMKNLCNHCSSLCMALPVMVSRCPELSLWCLEFPWSSLNSRLLPDISWRVLARLPSWRRW